MISIIFGSSAALVTKYIKCVAFDTHIYIYIYIYIYGIFGITLSR